MPRPNLTLTDALEQRARALPTLTGEWVVLHGLLTAVRGHLPSARRLFESTTLFKGAELSSFHHQLALEWLLADAAAQGDEARLITLRQRPVDSAARTLLSGWVAQALPRPAPQPTHPRWPDAGSSLERAVAAHALVLDLPEAQVTVTHIERLGLTWSRALEDPNTLAWLTERARVAGWSDAREPLADLRHTLRDDFIGLLRRFVYPWEDILETSDLIPEAIERLRHELLHDFESAVLTLGERVDSERPKPLLDEWLEWNAVRERFEEIVQRSGPHDRRICFQTLKAPVCNWAVWLTNDREQRQLAHVVFRWLTDHAHAVGDESERLYLKNLRATA